MFIRFLYMFLMYLQGKEVANTLRLIQLLAVAGAKKLPVLKSAKESSEPRFLQLHSDSPVGRGARPQAEPGETWRSLESLRDVSILYQRLLISAEGYRKTWVLVPGEEQHHWLDPREAPAGAAGRHGQVPAGREGAGTLPHSSAQTYEYVYFYYIYIYIYYTHDMLVIIVILLIVVKHRLLISSLLSLLLLVVVVLLLLLLLLLFMQVLARRDAGAQAADGEISLEEQIAEVAPQTTNTLE